MVAKKRARRRSDDRDGFNEEEEAEPRWKPYPLDEDAVPRELESEFKPAGLRCNECGYMTKKSGLSGKQAIRAHLKVHIRDSSAAKSGLLKQAYWLIPAIVLFGLTIWIQGFAKITLFDLLGGGVITVVSTALMLLQIMVISEAVETFDRKTIRQTRILLSVSRVLGIFSLILGIFEFVGWYWLVAVIVMLVGGIWTAVGIEYASLQARRGKFRSSRYQGMKQARSEEAETELDLYRMNLKFRITGGRLDPLAAGGWLKRHLKALGLIDVRTSKKARPISTKRAGRAARRRSR